MKYDIFISYRREGGFETANLIASKLKLSGYRVFLDIHSMHSGDFSEQLKEKVKGCKDFVWVLSPSYVKNDVGTITRIDTLSFRDGVDYFRDEICWAIENQKNIIPVILDGFIVPKEFPQIIQDTLNASNPSCDLHTLQAVEASKNQHFDVSISELKRYLHSHPVIKWAIITLILSFLALFSLLSSFFFRSETNGNCVITLNETQKHSFPFEGADVELIVSNKSLGVQHIHTLQDKATYLDIKNDEFGKNVVVKFNADGYLPQEDTVFLESNLKIDIYRDYTYAKYWGTILDYQTNLPIDSVKVVVGNKETYTNQAGYYEIIFPIEEQTKYKHMMAIKDGYRMYDENVIYPRECRFHLHRNR